MSERRLLGHLTIAVVVKLVVLAVLWWAFVRGAAVRVDGDAAATHLAAPAAGQGSEATTRAGVPGDL